MDWAIILAEHDFDIRILKLIFYFFRSMRSDRKESANVMIREIFENVYSNRISWKISEDTLANIFIYLIITRTARLISMDKRKIRYRRSASRISPDLSKMLRHIVNVFGYVIDSKFFKSFINIRKIC
jgi:hypothetical protein